MSFVARGSGPSEGSSSGENVTAPGGSCDLKEGADRSSKVAPLKEGEVRLELKWRPDLDPTHFEVVNIVNSFDSVENVVLPSHDPQVSTAIDCSVSSPDVI